MSEMPLVLNEYDVTAWENILKKSKEFLNSVIKAVTKKCYQKMLLGAVAFKVTK